MDDKDKPVKREFRQIIGSRKSSTTVAVEVTPKGKPSLKFSRRGAPPSKPEKPIHHQRHETRKQPSRKTSNLDMEHRSRIEAALNKVHDVKESESLQNAFKKDSESVKTGEKKKLQTQEASFTKPPKAKFEAPREAPKRSEKNDRNDKRERAKLTISQALEDDGEAVERRGMSLAAIKRRRAREKRESQANLANFQKVHRIVSIPDEIRVLELASRMAVRSSDIIKSLKKLDIEAEEKTLIDSVVAEIIVNEYGHDVKFVSDSQVEKSLEEDADTEGNLKPRAPVVTIMGHVDHGKTSLLDKIRSSRVQMKESGGITQHIGAYQVELKNKSRITFIDTPGHAAFSSMRARGADITDIVVLVVAADDGVSAQTREAIDHALAAKKTIIVAINKIDLPDIDPDKVKTQLLASNIIVESLGGEILCVEVSANTGQGIDALLDAISLQAELLELKANPDAKASGVVLETRVSQGKGSLITLILLRGTLKIGDTFVVGGAWGKVRSLIDGAGKIKKSAIPGEPIEVMGLNDSPVPGDKLTVVANESVAKEIAHYRKSKESNSATVEVKSSIDDIFKKIKDNEIKELPIVLKSDVSGSSEAIKQALDKTFNEEAVVRILHSDIGSINDSDITLAAATGGIVIGFNVRAQNQVKIAAQRLGVSIKFYAIIYELIDDITTMLTKMRAPEERENILGNALIQQVFELSNSGKKFAGCKVTDGLMKRGEHLRLLRDNVVIHQGTLKSLRRFKEDVREVKSGFECGIGIEGYQDVQEGDTIECYSIVIEPR